MILNYIINNQDRPNLKMQLEEDVASYGSEPRTKSYDPNNPFGEIKLTAPLSVFGTRSVTFPAIMEDDDTEDVTGEHPDEYESGVLQSSTPQFNWNAGARFVNFRDKHSLKERRNLRKYGTSYFDLDENGLIRVNTSDGMSRRLYRQIRRDNKDIFNRIGYSPYSWSNNAMFSNVFGANSGLSAVDRLNYYNALSVMGDNKYRRSKYYTWNPGRPAIKELEEEEEKPDGTTTTTTTTETELATKPNASVNDQIAPVRTKIDWNKRRIWWFGNSFTDLLLKGMQGNLGFVVDGKIGPTTGGFFLGLTTKGYKFNRENGTITHGQYVYKHDGTVWKGNSQVGTWGRKSDPNWTANKDNLTGVGNNDLNFKPLRDGSAIHNNSGNTSNNIANNRAVEQFLGDRPYRVFQQINSGNNRAIIAKQGGRLVYSNAIYGLVGYAASKGLNNVDIDDVLSLYSKLKQKDTEALKEMSSNSDLVSLGRKVLSESEKEQVSDYIKSHRTGGQLNLIKDLKYGKIEKA